MIVLKRRNTDDKFVAIRADAILAVYDLPEGGGAEVSYEAPNGDILIARVVETAIVIADLVDRELS